MVRVEIMTDNAAFEGEELAHEARIILMEAARRIGRGETSGKLRDTNGNTVGSFEVTA